MAHAEAYLLWNMVCTGISLVLGGRLAGLAAPRKERLLLCAVLSAAGAMVCLYLPGLGPVVFFLCPFCVWLCYRENGISSCLRATMTTICAALLVGGGGTLLRNLGQSAVVSMSLAALMALLLWTLCVLLPTAFCDVKQVEISYGGESVLLPAMLDSGNLVRDPITSRPVIVVPARALRPLFPEVESLCKLTELPPGFRLLRVRTAAGSGLWPLFRPDICRVYVNGQVSDAIAMIAVAGEEYSGVQALVPLAASPSSHEAFASHAATEAV